MKVAFHKRSDDGSGKATLVPSEDAIAYGAIFSLGDTDLPALRKAEGYPKHYDEKEVRLSTLDGERDAVTYIATSPYIDETQMPYRWYVDLIRFGGRQLGLPAAHRVERFLADRRSDAHHSV